jgi:hypothetical protein
LEAIWQGIQGLSPTSLRQQVLYGELIGKLNELERLRAERLGDAHEELPHVIWLALIAGAVLTIGFAFFLGTENVSAHGVMIAVLGALLGIKPLVRAESLLAVIRQRVPADFVGLNNDAFNLGLSLGEFAATKLAFANLYWQRRFFKNQYLTISGNTLVVYALIISPVVPDAAGQLLTASLVSAPARTPLKPWLPRLQAPPRPRRLPLPRPCRPTPRGARKPCWSIRPVIPDICSSWMCGRLRNSAKGTCRVRSMCRMTRSLRAWPRCRKTKT